MLTGSKVYFYFVLVTEMWVCYTVRANAETKITQGTHIGLHKYRTHGHTHTHAHTVPSHKMHTHKDTDKWDLSEIAGGFSAMVMISSRAVKTLCIWSPSPLRLSTETNTHAHTQHQHVHTHTRNNILFLALWACYCRGVVSGLVYEAKKVQYKGRKTRTTLGDMAGIHIISRNCLDWVTP